MNLRLCNISDLNRIINIGRRTYYDTFHQLNTRDTMSQYLDEAFSVEKISKELNNPKSFFYFLYDKELLVGYMKVNFYPAQSDINDPESLELERIYVSKEFKGQGYGKFMIEKTMAIAKDNGCTKVWLGVWEKNSSAISFYQRMGFEIIGRHTFRMGEEIQNDLVLQRMIL
ncbi:GNAT family N-acetyltransferase [Marispirochaeta aestuarii]|uniref:GNAT family N-acetyltransferase n=1 Tax=Marispirochaeta aestuarii TaxID=1963862 RepID=UPI0029C76A36|nr:GNAT family N-acetyltransferase [Marispirochaeta aestuarii]